MMIFASFMICSVASAEMAAEEVGAFAIKRQPLSSALLDFSFQTNVQVVVPGALVEGMLAKPVNGELTLAQALDILLSGSDLKYEFIGERTVALRRKLPSEKSVQAKFRRRAYDEFSVEQSLFVTAKNISNPVQDVSLSVAVLNGEDLESRGVTKADELQQFVPGLTVDSAQLGSTEFSIRGIGFSNDDLSTQAGVGVFIDDIYIPRQGPANMALYELDRVEVLRGPQSTQYARNATGGALVYRTRKPSADFEARYLVDIGSKGRFNNTITLNGEVTEGVMGQFAVASYARDPIMKNSSPGQPDGNDVDTVSARASLRVVQSAKLEWLFSVDTENTEQAGPLYSIGPGEPFQFAPGVPLVEASRTVRTANVSFTGGENLDIQGLMARANLTTDHYKFAYILGLREHHLEGLYDLDQLPADLVAQSIAEESSLQSFETQLASLLEVPQARAGDTVWSTGIRVLQEDAELKKSFIATGLGFGTNAWKQDLQSDNYSIYGQASYWLTNRLHVITGIRYLSEFKEFGVLAQTGNPVTGNPYIQQNFSLKQRRDWRRLTPKLGLYFEYTPELDVYLSFATAYKSGGFPGTPGDLAAANRAFKGESVQSFEFGLRSKLFANRIKFDMAVFFADYQDLQVTGYDQFAINFIENAPAADINGFELELQARPSTSLKLSLGMSYIDAEFDNFVLRQAGLVIDKSGDRVPNTPDATMNMSVVYFFPETQYGSFSMRLDAVYSAEAVDVYEELAWSSYKVFNLWFDFKSQRGHWETGFWIRNMGDKDYFQASAAGVSADNEALARKLEPPRLLGLSYKYYW